MGSGIPLPALDVRPPQQQQGPMDQYGKLLSLRNLMGQGQLQQGQQQLQQGQIKEQQFAIQNREAGMKAMQAWDGKDPHTIPDLMAKNGADFATVTAAREHLLQQEVQRSKMAEQDANTGSKNIETLTKRYDLTRGALGQLDSVPDEQLAAAIPQIIGPLRQQGILDGQHVQQAAQTAQLAQTDPKAARAQIKLYKKGMMSETQQLAKAKDDADLAAKKAELPGQQAGSQIKVAEANLMSQGGLPENMAKMKYDSILAKITAHQPVSAVDLSWAKAHEAGQAKTTTSSDSLGINTTSTSGPAGLSRARGGSGSGGGGGGAGNGVTAAGMSLVPESGVNRLGS